MLSIKTVWLCAAAADTHIPFGMYIVQPIAKGEQKMKNILFYDDCISNKRSKNDFIMHKLGASKCPQGLLMIIKLI